jgi:hypothetical protein
MRSRSVGSLSLNVIGTYLYPSGRWLESGGGLKPCAADWMSTMSLIFSGMMSVLAVCDVEDVVAIIQEKLYRDPQVVLMSSSDLPEDGRRHESFVTLRGKLVHFLKGMVGREAHHRSTTETFSGAPAVGAPYRSSSERTRI